MILIQFIHCVSFFMASSAEVVFDVKQHGDIWGLQQKCVMVKILPILSMSISVMIGFEY